MKKYLLYVYSLIFSASANAQIVQISPSENQAVITFTGTITNDPTSAIQLIGPNGSSIPYTGTVPAYPYKIGDAVKLTYTVDIPSPQGIAGGGFSNYLGSDGLYHFPVLSGGVNGPVSTQSETISFADAPAQTVANPNMLAQSTGITLNYNPTSGNYGLQSTGTTGWNSPLNSIPTYDYNPNSNSLSATDANGQPVNTFQTADCLQQLGCTTTPIKGNDTSAKIGSTSGIPIINSVTGAVAGFLSALDISGMFNFGNFAGSANQPSVGNSATDVPEPSAFILFGVGALGLIIARRRRKVA